MKTTSLVLALLGAATIASHAAPDLRFTEIQYTGLYGEFVEITNVAANAGGGANDIDLSTVDYSDNHNFSTGYVVPLSATSLILEPGKSFIITEAAPEIFDLAWYSLPSSSPNNPNRPSTLAGIKGDVTVNLGRADSVIIRDNILVTQIDRLDYDDQGTGNVKGPRTEDVSAVPGVAAGNAIPSNTFSGWLTSQTWKNNAGTTIGQPVGSVNPWKSGRSAAVGTYGSPGLYNR